MAINVSENPATRVSKPDVIAQAEAIASRFDRDYEGIAITPAGEVRIIEDSEIDDTYTRPVKIRRTWY